jgi:poly(3-hydroxyalkanoate) synthetase
MATQQHRQQQALPLHLTLAMLPLLASRTALQLSKNGLNHLNAHSPDLCPPILTKLQRAWTDLQSDTALAKAVEAEAKKRTIELLTGVYKYNHSSFTRDTDEPPAVLTLGSARLLDYGCKSLDAPTVFLIPSLINRYYIMDLTKKLSLARFLRDNGFHVFMVDWGMPSVTERHFNTALYVTEILVPMAEWIRTNTTGSVTYGGYCMGGLLALALACIRPELADNAAFFATPWDFMAPGFPRFAMGEKEIADLKEHLNSRNEIPAELIHVLFHYANPNAFHNKLRDFAHMDPSSPNTQDFVAIEDWANDGVTMTKGVAEDCLISWVQYNQPARKEWRVGGQIIDPQKLNMPCFVAAPQDDKIVPANCALPLANLLKKRTIIEPRSGHVSMMAGRHRKSALWEPFCSWLKKVA